MAAQRRRPYEIERDRFGLMYSGPNVAVGEVRMVYEASDVDAERDRILDLLERSFRSYMADADIDSNMTEIGALLEAHGRLSGGDG